MILLEHILDQILIRNAALDKNKRRMYGQFGQGGFFYVQRSYPINIWIIAVTSTVANRSGNLDHSRGSGICPASVTADSPKPCRFRQTAGQDPGYPAPDGLLLSGKKGCKLSSSVSCKFSEQ